MVYPNVCYYQAEQNGIQFICTRKSRFAYPLHNHISVFTIGMVLEGEVRLEFGKKVIHYKKDETFLIRPYEAHRLYAKSPTDLFCACIDKSQRITSQKFRESLVSFLLQSAKRLKLDRCQIRMFLCQYARVQALSHHPFIVEEPLLEKLRQNIEQYPQQRISVDRLAQKACRSKYYFIRQFKEKIGLTPHQFQLQNRIRRAKQLLHQIPMLTEVALLTGFCDQSHFIKQFKKFVGLPPSGYKAACIFSGIDKPH